MTHKTTKAHFEYFRQRFLYWADRFSLNEWEWEFEHSAHEESLAWARFWKVNRCATIGLAPIWENTKPSMVEMDGCALHEALEMLIAPLNDLARERFVTELQVTETTHATVRRLENFILGADRK